MMKGHYIKPESIVVALADNLCDLDEFSGVDVDGDPVDTKEGNPSGGLTSKEYDCGMSWDLDKDLNWD